MKKITSIVGAILAIVVALFLLHMNKVPTNDENVAAAWSQVQNQYKRRADLIPNLISTVKGYAAHEKEVFTEVTEARTNVGKLTITPEVLSDPKAFAMFEKAQDDLSSALSRLMMVSERYPALKSDKNFLALQTQLEGTENRIAVARKDYIAAVKVYNIELRTIPGRWVAAFLYPDATIKQTFSATEAEQKTPEVKF
jgi:LemA protein